MAEEFKKKELNYRGKTIDELKALGVREFAEFVKSRERRNILRNFQTIESFVSRLKARALKNKTIKTHSREMVVVPQMVGAKIGVHNGKEFVPVEITIEMLGHKLGEFALTRTKTKHTKSGVGASKGSKVKAKK